MRFRITHGRVRSDNVFRYVVQNFFEFRRSNAQKTMHIINMLSH